MNLQQQAHKKTINVMQCRSTYTTGGGPDKTVLLIGEKADPEKFTIVLMYVRGGADREFQVGEWARQKGLTIHEVLERGKFSVENVKEIHRLIQRDHIDIVHTRDYKTAVLVYPLTFFHPQVKFIFTAHLWQDLDEMKMKFYTWLNLKALKRYHKVIAVSGALKQFMIERGVKKEKIVVVHNAIDVDAWNREHVSSTIREEFKIPSASSKLIGVVGRLRSEKDLLTTLRVAQTIIRERPDTYFLIVGDGPDREMLEQEVQRMELSDNIFFSGFRKDTLNIYAGLDIFLSTARTEGTPNTALEAMAMEIPVVYTAVGGVPELIEDGKDGLLCNVGDIEGISQALLSILNDEEKARKIGEAGRQTVCAKFSFTSRLKKLEAIYEEVFNAQ